MKMLPLQGSAAETRFLQKNSTAAGGRPDGGISPSLCLVRASLRSPDAAKLA
jgi:hypothetical protein